MASMQLNGEVVHLKPQNQAEFKKLTAIILERMKPDEPIRQSYALMLFEAMAKDLPVDGPVVQTLLWALHDLGVAQLAIDVPTNKIDLVKVSDTETSRGDVRALAVAAIESGRALTAAIVNAHGRSMLLNGELLRAFPQPREDVERIIGQIRANRLVNEDLMFTAGRALGAYMKAGKTMSDPEYRAAVEVLAALGVADVVIDLEGGKLGLRACSEANAACMALLQGADAKQVQQVRERIQQMVKRIDEAMKQGNTTPVQQTQRIAIPPMIGSRHTRRRQ